MTKVLKLKYVFFLSFLLVSCFMKNEHATFPIKKIKVYKTSFGIINPVSISRSDIKEMTPYIIDDVEGVKRIYDLISKMELHESNKFTENIYLFAEIENIKGKKFSLFYNKFLFNYNGKNYKVSEKLLGEILSFQPKEFLEFPSSVE